MICGPRGYSAPTGPVRATTRPAVGRHRARPPSTGDRCAFSRSSGLRSPVTGAGHGSGAHSGACRDHDPPPNASAVVDGFADEIAEMALALHGEPTLEQTVDRVLEFAVKALDCSYAGVIFVHKRTRVETFAATDPLVAELDKIQFEVGQGPDLEIIEDHRGVLVHDTTIDDRWPEWARTVAATGVRSMLGTRLHTSETTIGSLNLYDVNERHFTHEDRAVADIFARHAAVAMSSSREEANLWRAIDARQTIGQAQGILMERFGVDAGPGLRGAAPLLPGPQREAQRGRGEAHRLTHPARVSDAGETTGESLPRNWAHSALVAVHSAPTGASRLSRQPVGPRPYPAERSCSGTTTPEAFRDERRRCSCPGALHVTVRRSLDALRQDPAFLGHCLGAARPRPRLRDPGRQPGPARRHRPGRGAGPVPPALRRLPREPRGRGRQRQDRRGQLAHAGGAPRAAAAPGRPAVRRRGARDAPGSTSRSTGCRCTPRCVSATTWWA